jgi:hypothetical protein
LGEKTHRRPISTGCATLTLQATSSMRVLLSGIAAQRTSAADSPAVKRDLLIVVEAGNEMAGEGSHWLEEREA